MKMFYMLVRAIGSPGFCKLNLQWSTNGWAVYQLKYSLLPADFLDSLNSTVVMHKACVCVCVCVGGGVTGHVNL